MRFSRHCQGRMSISVSIHTLASANCSSTTSLRDWRDVLPRIDVPTWVVTGRHSPFYDLDGMEWFASEVQNGSLSVFERSGHSPHLNEPDEFNKQLMKFLTS
jgi:pimeloyl-ACP methyl ester carboxylesterase